MNRQCEERPLWQLAVVSLGAAGIAAAAIFGLSSLGQQQQQQLFVTSAVPQTQVQTAPAYMQGLRVRPVASRIARPASTAAVPGEVNAQPQVAQDWTQMGRLDAPKSSFSLGWLMLVAIPLNAALVALVRAVANSTQPQSSEQAMFATTGRMNTRLYMQSSDAPEPVKSRPFQNVPVPRQEPKFTESPIGFVKNAEIINSRAAMMGFIALLIVELILGGPLLEQFGVVVGNGIDIGL